MSDADSAIARDVRRALFAAIPALGRLAGSERYRAEAAIEDEVERAFGEWYEGLCADAEGVP